MAGFQVFFGFLFGAVTTFAAVMIFMFFVPSEQQVKTLSCGDRETKIGVVIDGKHRQFIMAGQKIDKEKIKTFSDILIDAEWKHAEGSTRVTLDRLTGELEMREKSNFMGDEKTQNFKCHHVSQRF